MLVGEYENHQYDGPNKNKYHYVTITYDEHANSYKWKNRAGVSWVLFPSKISNILNVGNNIYSPGYSTSEFDELGIYGPHREYYRKESNLPPYGL